MSANIFNSIKIQVPNTNRFDLTHDVKMSGRMGNMMPNMVMECVPGDKFTLGCDNFIRFAPLIAPVMHRLDVKQEYWFVPNRLVWPSWEAFIANETTGGLPTILMDGSMTAAEKRFADYMGIPPNASPLGVQVSAIPFAAYQFIYNQKYRDQNLIAEVNYALTDGAQNNAKRAVLCTMRKRALEHDYFTACLPFAQKGDAVELPLGDVELDPDWNANGDIPVWDAGGIPSPDGIIEQSAGRTQVNTGGIPPTEPTAYDPDGSLFVGPTTINSLRRAFALQRWLEKAALGGTRYIELIKKMFGVNSSDKRLQQPEFITGTKSPVVISEVLNTTGETSGLPQGNMAGHAVSIGEGYSGSYYCEEHGYIIGIVTVMPKPAYMQGIPRTYLKTDPMDFFWPDFQHIGEQEVKNVEIYSDGATPDGTFGYIPRYAEYKYMPNRVAGDFRTTLDYWTCTRQFGSLPTLSQQFIECDADDYDQIFAVTAGDDNLYMHILHKIKANRKMAVYGQAML